MVIQSSHLTLGKTGVQANTPIALAIGEFSSK